MSRELPDRLLLYRNINSDPQISVASSVMKDATDSQKYSKGTCHNININIITITITTLTITNRFENIKAITHGARLSVN